MASEPALPGVTMDTREPGSFARAARPSTWRATLLVAGKEIRTSFRDRQTTLYTVVLPIALYPFLFWCLIQGALFVKGRRERTEVGIGIALASEVHAAEARDRTAQRSPAPDADAAERSARSRELRESSGALVRALESTPAPKDPTLDDHARAQFAAVNRVRVDELRDRLGEDAAREWMQRAQDEPREHLDAILYVPPAAAQPRPSDDSVAPRAVADDGSGASPRLAGLVPDEERVAIFYDSTRTASDLARERVRDRLPPYAKELRVSRLPAGSDAAELVPFQKLAAHNIAPDREQGAYLLSFLLPMLLVIMTVMGAFFPAVDLTAGERERSTSETTLLLPVPRLSVHQGKILAVCAGSVIATVLNLFALALSAGHLIHMFSQGTRVQIDVPIGAFVAMAPLALLFAFFVSAALTGIASLARTFKEGQALLGPVQMVFIVPAMASAIPGLELTPKLACIPVLNVVLAFRSLISGRSLPLEYTLTGASLFVSALIAIVVAVKLLSRESIFAPEGSREAARAGARTWHSWFGGARGGKA